MKGNLAFLTLVLLCGASSRVLVFFVRVCGGGGDEWTLFKFNPYDTFPFFFFCSNSFQWQTCTCQSILSKMFSIYVRIYSLIIKLFVVLYNNKKNNNCIVIGRPSMLCVVISAYKRSKSLKHRSEILLSLILISERKSEPGFVLIIAPREPVYTKPHDMPVK